MKIPNETAIIAEYKEVRKEILQINAQIFTILTSGIGLILTIDGWIFISKTIRIIEEIKQNWYIPLFSITLLAFINVIILHRNRLAHRLALFQKYFIERRIPDICWARVYFTYRDNYQQSLLERISDNSFFILILIQVFHLGLSYWLKPDSMWNGIFLVVIIIQCIIKNFFNDFVEIENTFREIALRSGIFSEDGGV